VVELPKLDVIVSPGEASTYARPWRYLWPSIDSSGEVALESDEQVLHQWIGANPAMLWFKPDGSKGGLTLLLQQATSGCHYTLTSSRIIAIAKIDIPGMAREDYSLKLALVSPGLANTVAAAKQITRRLTAKTWYCVLQIRFEWAEAVGVLAAVGEKKKLFGGTRASTEKRCFVEIPVADGRKAQVWLSRAKDEQGFEAVDDLSRKLRDALSSHSTQEPSMTEGVHDTGQVVETATQWTFDGAQPWSFPAHLTLPG